MSNTAYTKSSRAPGDPYDEGQATDEEYDEYDDYDEYGDPEEKVGLFSTPARTVSLVASFVVLLAVAVGIAWILGQNAKGSGAATSSFSPVNPSVKSAPKTGALAPDFTLTNVHTKQPLQLSSLRGKPVLLNFWGTWCPPCRAEMPELQKLYDKYKNDVEFVGVSMGPRDEPAGVDQFVKLNKYTWTFIHDTDASISINYQVQGIPSTFFIDKDGIIRSIHVGGADGPILQDGLDKARQSQ